MPLRSNSLETVEIDHTSPLVRAIYRVKMHEFEAHVYLVELKPHVRSIFYQTVTTDYETMRKRKGKPRWFCLWLPWVYMRVFVGNSGLVLRMEMGFSKESMSDGDLSSGKLALAPFPNIHLKGSVCFGNVDFKEEQSGTRAALTAVQAFFASRFNSEIPIMGEIPFGMGFDGDPHEARSIRRYLRNWEKMGRKVLGLDWNKTELFYPGVLVWKRS